MSEVRRYSYPRFVGGPAAKKKVPAMPPERQSLEIAAGPTTAYFNEMDAPTFAPSFSSTTYSKHRGGFGPTRVMEFWADSRLAGEDAFDQLVTDMFSRCGVRRED